MTPKYVFDPFSSILAGASQEDYRDLFNELHIMSSVEEHPNIVNLLGACTGKGNLNT
jgi:hypothetical protein